MEEGEINYAKKLLKTKQARLNEDNCHSFQYFEGKFDVLSKTTTLFQRNDKLKTASAKNSIHCPLVE